MKVHLISPWDEARTLCELNITELSNFEVSTEVAVTTCANCLTVISRRQSGPTKDGE